MRNDIYSRIERFEEEIYPSRKGLFLKERQLFAGLAELTLESSKPLEGRLPSDDGPESELLVLITRMFDDFEAAKLLLSFGLPEQAPPLLRDAIECTLYARLFLHNTKAAKKWVGNLAQYSAGDVVSRLGQLGIVAPEYALYGTLSHLAHTNLLCSLTHVDEVDVGQSGVARTFHFGGAKGEQTEVISQAYFCLMFMLMTVALAGPLARIRHRHLPGFDDWLNRLKAVSSVAEEITAEIASKLRRNPTRPAWDALVERRMKLDELTSRVGELTDADA